MIARLGETIPEHRLEELRERGAQGELTSLPGVRPEGSPIPVPRASAEQGYYGLPLLKEPTWTWQVPLYFFTGGAAGASAVIAAATRLTRRRDARLARDASWIAAAGALTSAPLLIADLGRPERFLNMLRVFKVRSPMSVGAWTLVAFSNAASAAAFANWIDRRQHGRIPVRVVADVAHLLAAATGLVMTTYPGVLIGATAIPVWSRNVAVLPLHFGASAIASAASLLELCGHDDPALDTLATCAAAVETAVATRLELDRDPALAPLKRGASGFLTRTGAALSGPIPLVLRLLGRRDPRARRAAACCALFGSLLTRFAWVRAGRASARDPRVPLRLPEQRTDLVEL
jgi:formate-dependent nitrite reductase membrane component NrfD